MRPNSSRSDVDPFAHLVARGAVAEATESTAWLQTMLDVEAALAAAQAAAGDITAGAAAEIIAACRTECFDLDAIRAATEDGGVAVIGLVEQLRAAVGSDAAEFVHRGATSQDIMDTAAMVIAARSAVLASARLDDARAAVDVLSDEHGTAPMIGRTLGQYAVPTTFSNVTRRWHNGLADAATALQAVASSLPVQLGGPVGDGSSYGARAADVAVGVAERLGLAVPDAPWSSVRAPIARIAGAWGVVAAVVGDIATQLVALMASDVGELAERFEGSGGSSSMAHKRNPVAAISARAAALQLPGLVGTLLHAAAGHDFERASGSWHAEGPALNALLRAGGAATDWLATSLKRVVVDTDRMVANLQRAEAERGAP